MVEKTDSMLKVKLSAMCPPFRRYESHLSLQFLVDTRLTVMVDDFDLLIHKTGLQKLIEKNEKTKNARNGPVIKV